MGSTRITHKKLIESKFCQYKKYFIFVNCFFLIYFILKN